MKARDIEAKIQQLYRIILNEDLSNRVRRGAAQEMKRFNLMRSKKTVKRMEKKQRIFS